jgi:arylsulfatase A-like enzyme
MRIPWKPLFLLVVPLVLLGAGTWIQSYLLGLLPIPRVTHLMTLPPADIRLSSPLWDYRATLTPEWIATEKAGGFREYTWTGTLQTDPNVPGLAVLSGGKELTSLSPKDWETTSSSGYLYTPSREKLLVKDYFFASDHTNFFVAHLEWDQPILEWEALTITPDASPISLCLAFDGVWSSTVEVSCDDWTASSLPTSGVTEGTRTLYLRSTGTYSTLEKSQQRQIFLRNVKAKDPASIKVRLPLDAPVPVIRYRPLDPVEMLLSQPELPPQPAQSTPWTQYDESSLFVRPLDVDEIVRTGVFLPTPSEWCVSITPEESLDLVFYPMVRDPSNQTQWGAADLEVLLESKSGSIPLWRGEVNPQADMGHSAWKRGIRTPLKCPLDEPATLVFRSRGLPGAKGISQPVLVGEPVLLPSRDPSRQLPPDTPKSVILISVDTLRADAVGCIGGGKATPWMDQFFGQEGVVWTGAEAPCSWTLPSHASLMLSQYLSRHGIVMHYDSIPSGAVTLAEHFAAHQYETAAFVDREYLNYRFGFHQGFVQYDQVGGHFKSSLPRCLDYLRNRDRSVPLFLFLHSYDTHDPYTPPEEYRKRFLREGLEPSTPDLINPELQWFTLTKSSLGQLTLAASDSEYMRSVYLAEVAYVDDMLRDFFNQVTAEQLLDDPLVVLVSDHGEAFFEHKMWTHGKMLYEEVLRVPVLFRFPQKQYAGHRMDGRVTLIDVPPSLFGILGWEIPSNWQGISLLEHMANPTVPVPPRRIYSEWANASRSLFALIQRNQKFIKSVKDDIEVEKVVRSSQVEAYDLEKDPGETTNLASSTLSQATQELDQTGKELGQMHELLQADGKFEEADLDPATIRSLQAIGYLQPERDVPKE